jgi:hypothetical protein
MRINLVGAFVRNAPFGTEIAFKKGFDRLGCHLVNTIDTSYSGQVWDYDADVTVVFKWMEDYWHDLKMCRGKKIVYQPDDLRFPHIQEMMRKMMSFCDFAFTFDNDGADLARKIGYRKAERLLLTADDELYRPVHGLERDIDVSFIGSLTHGGNHTSRMRMCQVVAGIPGIRTAFLSDIYDMEKIVEVYNRSKIVLNHATDVGQDFGHGFGYQCRHFEAGLTGACVLSNRVDNERELENIEEFESEAELVGRVHYLLHNHAVRRARGENLLAELRAAHLPQHRAAQMVRFIEGL